MESWGHGISTKGVRPSTTPPPSPTRQAQPSALLCLPAASRGLPIDTPSAPRLHPVHTSRCHAIRPSAHFVSQSLETHVPARIGSSRSLCAKKKTHVCSENGGRPCSAYGLAAVRRGLVSAYASPGEKFSVASPDLGHSVSAACLV